MDSDGDKVIDPLDSNPYNKHVTTSGFVKTMSVELTKGSRRIVPEWEVLSNVSQYYSHIYIYVYAKFHL